MPKDIAPPNGVCVPLGGIEPPNYVRQQNSKEANSIVSRMYCKYIQNYAKYYNLF